MAVTLESLKSLGTTFHCTDLLNIIISGNEFDQVQEQRMSSLWRVAHALYTHGLSHLPVCFFPALALFVAKLPASSPNERSFTPDSLFYVTRAETIWMLKCANNLGLKAFDLFMPSKLSCPENKRYWRPDSCLGSQLECESWQLLIYEAIFVHFSWKW